jgi:hypothetical protein
MKVMIVFCFNNVHIDILTEQQQQQAVASQSRGLLIGFFFLSLCSMTKE